jgi:hypothetical protein
MVDLFLFVLCISAIFLVVLFGFLMLMAGQLSEEERERGLDV